MNTILQQRIEEAARKEREQCREDNNEIWRGNPTYNDVEASFIKGATFALQNQWISADEALPEKEQCVLVAVLDTKSNTYFGGFDNIDDDNGEFLRDKNGFAIENDSHKITHWMPVPELKGGEK